ncbi:hypothetical protein ASV00_23625 [Enterobacter cloacae subsp. cloacae]|uniref:Uncharacterized protein n=1 Tax=Cronobacter sakazakii (strain ATCC BAA-894) TaxID=290339 RepID=A7MFZ5_CROS8|nr:hypothetical protein ESA_02338 [Cronobacter sakazakii ATCC BAA-894]KTI60863.1 hypothetical protein ASV00_23625 [Enterobacter cloacae subsp. cloacae]HAV6915291.1 hypothetical protein [Cronobacter sakazakii]
MTNFLIEILATLIYMFVLFPMFIVLNLFFMILTVLVLPIKIPFVKNYIYKHILRNTTKIDK